MSIIDAACDAWQRRSPGRKPSVQSGCDIGRISVNLYSPWYYANQCSITKKRGKWV